MHPSHSTNQRWLLKLIVQILEEAHEQELVLAADCRKQGEGGASGSRARGLRPQDFGSNMDPLLRLSENYLITLYHCAHVGIAFQAGRETSSCTISSNFVMLHMIYLRDHPRITFNRPTMSSLVIWGQRAREVEDDGSINLTVASDEGESLNRLARVSTSMLHSPTVLALLTRELSSDMACNRHRKLGWLCE